MDNGRHSDRSERTPWWARMLVGAITGAAAAALLSVLVAAIGLALGLVTWSTAALAAAGRLVAAVFAVFILLGMWRGLVAAPTRATPSAGARDDPSDASDGDLDDPGR
jgi:hypothetical protein